MPVFLHGPDDLEDFKKRHAEAYQIIYNTVPYWERKQVFNHYLDLPDDKKRAFVDERKRLYALKVDKVIAKTSKKAHPLKKPDFGRFHSQQLAKQVETQVQSPKQVPETPHKEPKHGQSPPETPSAKRTKTGPEEPGLPEEAGLPPVIDVGHHTAASEGGEPVAAGQAGENMAMPQSGGGVPGGTGSSQQPRTIGSGSSSAGSFSFKKAFQIETSAYQFKSGLKDVNIQDTSAFNSLATPLAVINPNDLRIYMSMAEFTSMLPSTAFAEKATVKITPMGFRLPFATNEAASTYANSQTLVQIMFGKGIERHTMVSTSDYSVDQSDVTDPTGRPAVPDLIPVIYGKNGGNVTGNPAYWPQYASFHMNSGDIQGRDVFRLLDHTSIANINDHKGVPCINYDYDFKYAPIKLSYINNWEQMATRNRVTFGCTTAGFVSKEGGNSNVAGKVNINYTQHGDQWWATNFSIYQTYIEKAMWMKANQGFCDGPCMHPPLCYVGCMPVQSSPNKAPKETYTPCSVIWLVETELVVSTHANYISSNSAIFSSSFMPSFNNIMVKDYNSVINGSIAVNGGWFVEQSIYGTYDKPLWSNVMTNTLAVGTQTVRALEPDEEDDVVPEPKRPRKKLF